MSETTTPIAEAEELLEAVAPRTEARADEEAEAPAPPEPAAEGSEAGVAGEPRSAAATRTPRKRKVAAPGRGKRASKPNAKGRRVAPSSGKRGRSPRVIPATSFEDALEVALGIQQYGADGRVRRLTLFDQFDKSPESGSSRQMITNSSRYNLTTGSYAAEWLELTPLGRKATDEESSPREKLRARFTLAIEQIEPFKLLYDRLRDHRVPAHATMRDILAESGVPGDQLQECVDTFIVNAKFLGLLRPIAGSERLISIEQLLDELPGSQRPAASARPRPEEEAGSATVVDDWSRICFYVTPIGADTSEQRKHSDVILAALVEPAMNELDLTVVRADQIEKPGVITKQVIEHAANARLVIADLSFHNPNAFYELALRHATFKPTVHLIRKGDPIPFDIGQFRTIEIDTTDIHSFVPQIETWRAEIATHARRALEEEDVPSGPLAVFYPDFGKHLAWAA